MIIRQVNGFKLPVVSMMKILGGAVLALLAGCFSLDPFLFSGEPLSSYQFDRYTGERECADALDTVKALEAAGFAPAVTDTAFRQYRIKSGDGEISVVLLSQTPPPFSASDTIVVYFRGKGPHIDFYWPRTRLLHAAGYPVVILDYRGFGMSEGSATEASISEDGHATMAFVHDSLGNPRVVAYAYSLGSLAGCDVLANGLYPQMISLILEAPIGSIETIVENGSVLDIPGSYLSSYTGDNTERIKSIQVPLLWIHGTSDETNDRETQGLPIWNNHPGEGYYIKTIGAKHTTNPMVIGYSRYVRTIRSFIQGAPLDSFEAILGPNRSVEYGKK
jgi:pimeloyl-ACP methyl ester carboxylesterase